MADSSDSPLSTPPASEDEVAEVKIPKPKTLSLKGGKLVGSKAPKKKGRRASASSSSPSPERAPSPPHEYVLADNPVIPVIVTFRARFNEAFHKNVPNLGPQDIETGVVGSHPSEQIETFLCALLDLVLNRKKRVERGHHDRALEEAIQQHKYQWPASWNSVNPLHGANTFQTMSSEQRLSVLHSLLLWSLNTSDVITSIIKESYKQSRHDDDKNQPLSVQPWGADRRKRRYWLIEGLNDTTFRLYRESPPKIIHKTWYNVAGTLDELKTLAEQLRNDGSVAGRNLADRIQHAVPRLEESENKRQRRDYRAARRAAFTRPELSFSLYEGRTRGKRLKYTFSSDEDIGSDGTGTRRSTRHTRNSSPAEPQGPAFTSSGRISKYGRANQESRLRGNEQIEDFDSSELKDDDGDSQIGGIGQRPTRGRPRATRLGQGLNGHKNSSGNEMDEDEDVESSGNDWHDEDDDVDVKFEDEEEDDEDEDEEMSDELESEDDLVRENKQQSLVVKLPVRNQTLPLSPPKPYQPIQPSPRPAVQEVTTYRLHPPAPTAPPFTHSPYQQSVSAARAAGSQQPIQPRNVPSASSSLTPPTNHTTSDHAHPISTRPPTLTSDVSVAENKLASPTPRTNGSSDLALVRDIPTLNQDFESKPLTSTVQSLKPPTSSQNTAFDSPGQNSNAVGTPSRNLINGTNS